MTWYADRLRRIADQHDSDAEDEEVAVPHLSKTVATVSDPARRVYVAALISEAKANAKHHRERAFVLRGMAEEVGRG